MSEEASPCTKICRQAVPPQHHDGQLQTTGRGHRPGKYRRKTDQKGRQNQVEDVERGGKVQQEWVPTPPRTEDLEVGTGGMTKEKGYSAQKPPQNQREHQVLS